MNFQFLQKFDFVSNFKRNRFWAWECGSNFNPFHSTHFSGSQSVPMSKSVLTWKTIKCRKVFQVSIVTVHLHSTRYKSFRIKNKIVCQTKLKIKSKIAWNVSCLAFQIILSLCVHVFIVITFALFKRYDLSATVCWLFSSSGTKNHTEKNPSNNKRRHRETSPNALHNKFYCLFANSGVIRSESKCLDHTRLMITIITLMFETKWMD